jgi:hypothetical protein
MTEDAARWMIGVAAGMAAALAARVQLLPDVIDLSIIPTGAGLGSLLACAVGSACRFDADRLGRVALFGTLFGAGATAVGMVLASVI